MIVYLDMCVLKRPFDDQTQPRIALEAAAGIAIVQAAEAGRLRAVRSVAHEVENARNPDRRRTGAVQVWLDTLNALEPGSVVQERARELVAEGFRPLDALHLAWAEHLRAEVFLSTDDRLISKSHRMEDRIRVRVMDPVAFVRENDL